MFTKLLDKFWDRKSKAKIDKLISEHPLSRNHRSVDQHSRRGQIYTYLIQEAPPLTWWRIEYMRKDPHIKLALLIRDGFLSLLEAKAGKGGSQEQNAWALDQWNRLWQDSRRELLETKYSGYGAFEVMWRENNGMLEVDRLHHISPLDVAPLRCEGQTVGASIVRGQMGASITNPIRMLAPKGLWTTFNSRYNDPWGETIMRAPYYPWHKKWMEKGVEKLTNLYMAKHAYIGDVGWAPPKKVRLADGTEISGIDLMREVTEARLSGAALIFPNTRDLKGEKEYQYERPQSMQGGNPFQWWKDKTNADIFEALGVLSEVVEASRTGSYSGRTVPLIALLSALMQEANELFQAVRRQVLEPGAHINFGRADFDLDLRPLTESVFDDMKGKVGNHADPRPDVDEHDDGQPHPAPMQFHRSRFRAASPDNPDIPSYLSRN